MRLEAAYYRRDFAAKVPEYGTPRSACFDLCSSDDVAIPAKGIAVVPTGLVIGVPPGHSLRIYARSSLPMKKGLMLANGIGVVDEDYCGMQDEIRILLYNTRQTDVTVKRGERIAQGEIVRVEHVTFSEFEPRDESRGGVGSTGGYL